MLRYILSFAFLFILGISCQNNCDENAPTPISFNIQWIDDNGADIYYLDKTKKDSLIAFYKSVRGDSVRCDLGISVFKKDSTRHFIDVMPLLRKAYFLQLDTVFLGIKKADIDTVVFKLVNEKNDCFSIVYRFENLKYNGKDLNGTDTLYKIVKKVK